MGEPNTSARTPRTNAELAHRIDDACNRRDLDAVLALIGEDLVFISRTGDMEGAYRGHDGIRRWAEILLDVLPDWTVDVVEGRDLGDATLAALRTRGHDAGSDAPVDLTIWHRGDTWRGGKLVRLRSLHTEAEAPGVVGPGA